MVSPIRGEPGHVYKVENRQYGFISSGNLAPAIISGLLSKWWLDPYQILVSCQSQSVKFHSLADDINIITDDQEVINTCSVVFLDVRPDELDETLRALKPVSNLGKHPPPFFVSTVVGLSTEALEFKLKRVTYEPRVIRVMTNFACKVQEGCTVYSVGTHRFSEDVDFVHRMFKVLGLCHKVNDSEIDTFSGLINSAPTFIYAAIEAVVDGAVKMGVLNEAATKFTVQAVVGAAAMVQKTELYPAVHRIEDCDRTGLASEALHALEKHSFRSSLISAVEASVNTSRAMGKSKNTAFRA